MQHDMHQELLSQPSHAMDDDLQLSMQHDLLTTQQQAINAEFQELLTPQSHDLDDDLQQDMHTQLLSMIQPVGGATSTPQKELSSPSSSGHALAAVQPQTMSSAPLVDMPTSISSSTPLQIQGQFSSANSSLQLQPSTSLSLSLLDPLVNATNEIGDAESLLSGMAEIKPHHSLESVSDFMTKSSPGQVVLTKPTAVPDNALSTVSRTLFIYSSLYPWSSNIFSEAVVDGVYKTRIFIQCSCLIAFVFSYYLEYRHN